MVTPKTLRTGVHAVTGRALACLLPSPPVRLLPLAALLSCGSLLRPAPPFQGWERLPGSPAAGNLRALSGHWASGSHGAFRNRERTGALPGDLDLRSLHAFDERRAALVNAGAPARFYLTSDGGAHWRLTREIALPGIFFDSMAFWSDREGLAIGDAIGGRFVLALTHDGGETWQDAPGPAAAPGEGAFAASNSCLAVRGSGEAWFASAARVFHTRDGGKSWTASAPGLGSSESKGLFSIAFRSDRRGYLTGGDYRAPASPGLFARTGDGGATWRAGAAPRGYRSAIAVFGDALVVAGPTGSDVSLDDGQSWARLGDEPLNALAVSGDELLAAGPDGVLLRLR